MNGRPETVADYTRLVDQVIDEMQDIIEAAGFDIDDVDSDYGFVEVLLKEMRELRATMADGSYQFGRHDLPLMRIVKLHTDKELPCIRLFYDINRTHKEGLDIPAD